MDALAEASSNRSLLGMNPGDPSSQSTASYAIAVKREGSEIGLLLTLSLIVVGAMLVRAVPGLRPGPREATTFFAAYSCDVLFESWLSSSPADVPAPATAFIKLTVTFLWSSFAASSGRRRHDPPLSSASFLSSWREGFMVVVFGVGWGLEELLASFAQSPTDIASAQGSLGFGLTALAVLAAHALSRYQRGEQYAWTLLSPTTTMTPAISSSELFSAWKIFVIAVAVPIAAGGVALARPIIASDLAPSMGVATLRTLRYLSWSKFISYKAQRFDPITAAYYLMSRAGFVATLVLAIALAASAGRISETHALHPIQLAGLCSPAAAFSYVATRSSIALLVASGSPLTIHALVACADVSILSHDGYSLMLASVAAVVGGTLMTCVGSAFVLREEALGFTDADERALRRDAEAAAAGQPSARKDAPVDTGLDGEEDEDVLAPVEISEEDWLLRNA